MSPGRKFGRRGNPERGCRFLNMNKIGLLNFAMRPLPTFLGLLLVTAGFLAHMPQAEADPCQYSTCGARDRMLGTTPLYRDPRRGFDLPNPRDRPLPTVKAKPFDLRPPGDPKKPGDFVLENPNVNDEHRRWCRQHYRSYDGISNTYTTFSGQTRYCDSPFD